MKLDLRAYGVGQNRWLSALVLACIAGLGMLLVGPPARWLAEKRERLGERRATYEQWQADFRDYRPITDEEQREWAARFALATGWLPAADDEARRIAAVARLFELGSTRELEVQPGRSLDELELGALDDLSFEPAAGGARVPVRAFPLQVSFKSGYADVERLLARLQQRQLPVYVEGLRLRRSFADVDVRLELVVFLRQGGAS